MARELTDFTAIEMLQGYLAHDFSPTDVAPDFVLGGVDPLGIWQSARFNYEVDTPKLQLALD